MATAFSLAIKSQIRTVEIKGVPLGDAEHWRLVGPSCEDICKGAGDQENLLKEDGGHINDDAKNVEKKERTAEEEQGKSG